MKIENPNEKVLLELMGKLNRDSKENNFSDAEVFEKKLKKFYTKPPTLA